MKPKNSKERRNSFLKFLALWAVTTALIVGAIFFDLKAIPEKDFDATKTELGEVNDALEYQQTFSNEMNIIADLVDSLKLNDNDNYDFVYRKTIDKINDLQETIPEADSYRTNMYRNTISSYNNLIKFSKKNNEFQKDNDALKKSLSDKEGELTKAERERDKYKNELKQYTDQYN